MYRYKNILTGVKLDGHGDVLVRYTELVSFMAQSEARATLYVHAMYLDDGSDARRASRPRRPPRRPQGAVERRVLALFRSPDAEPLAPPDYPPAVPVPSVG